MKKTANLLTAFALLLAGCTDAVRTKETLQKAGFTSVATGDYDAFSCGENDSNSTHFTATNPVGQQIEGTVCCSLFSTCTIRF